MKAFVNSLLTIMAAILILELLFSFQAFGSRAAEGERAAFTVKYAGYYFDDISYDLIRLAPETPFLSRLNSSHLALGFASNKNNITFQAAVANYTRSLASFAQKLNVNVSLNATNMSGSGINYTLSNGAQYVSDYGNPAKSYLVSSPSAAFENYTVVFNTSLKRKTITDFNYNPGGDLHVFLKFSDGNGTFISEGRMNSGQSNKFSATFANNGQFNITIGSVNGNPDSLAIIRSGNVSYSTYNSSVIVRSSNPGDVSMVIPVFLNVTGFGYSRAGAPSPLRA